MGYFSNGSEGMAYEARYCDRCVHQGPPDGPGCSVWLVHLLYNYGATPGQQQVLNELIPRGEHGDNGQCRMFIDVAAPSGGGQ